MRDKLESAGFLRKGKEHFLGCVVVPLTDPDHGIGKRAGLAAQANKLSAVKAFFHFLVRSDYLLVDPSKELTLPRTLKKLPSQLVTETEVERLLQTPDIALPLGLRDRAILELLYATAIRNKELLELEIDHVDLARGELFVARGKGNKSRRLPVGEEALAWVETYLLKVRPGIARSDSGKTLFLSYRGRMLDRANLAAVVRRHVKACGLEKRVTPHVLRHAWYEVVKSYLKFFLRDFSFEVFVFGSEVTALASGSSPGILGTVRSLNSLILGSRWTEVHFCALESLRGALKACRRNPPPPRTF